MVTATYQIAFRFPVDNSGLTIDLIADVEEHHSRKYYVISNFRTPKKAIGKVLPDVTIRKKRKSWIHVDSEKESDLSRFAGNAIEKYESNARKG